MRRKGREGWDIRGSNVSIEGNVHKTEKAILQTGTIKPYSMPTLPLAMTFNCAIE